MIKKVLKCEMCKIQKSAKKNYILRETELNKYTLLKLVV